MILAKKGSGKSAVTLKSKFKKKYYFRALDENGKEYKKLIAKPFKKRAFVLRIASLDARKGSEYYLKVSYGRHEDCFGKMSNFYNEGWTNNRLEIIKMFKAFDEVNEMNFKAKEVK